MTDEQKRGAALKFIVSLGIVSLLADMTYEGAHSIVGPYLKELGATAAQVAFIAGFGEMLAASLRYFSGRFADRTHAYWTITFLGYAMNVVSVPAMAYAGTWQVPLHCAPQGRWYTEAHPDCRPCRCRWRRA